MFDKIVTKSSSQDLGMTTTIFDNKVRNALVANKSVFKLFLTELNPTILKIFHVSQSVTESVTDRQTDGLQELLE